MRSNFRLRFSLRSLLLATLTLGAAAALWRNSEPWRIEREFPNGEGALAVRGFSPDGKWINADSVFNLPKSVLWNVETGRMHTVELAVIDGPQNCWSQFSGDSKLLLSQATNLKGCRAKLWDLKVASERDIAALKRTDLTSADLSIGGRYLVARIADKSVQLIDMRTNAVVLDEAGVTYVGFSATDDRVALVSGKEVVIRDTATWRELRRIEASGERTFTWPLHVSDSTLIVNVAWRGGSAQGFLCYALNEDREPSFFPGAAPSVSNDGTRALVVDASDGEIRVIDLRTHQVLAHIASKSDSILFKWLAGDTRVLDQITPAVFEAATGKLLFEIADPGTGSPSPDHSRMIWHNVFSDKGIHIHDLRNGERLQTIRATLGGIGSDIFSPDSQHFAAGSPESNAIHIWTRHRPERWWGLAWLPEFWLLIAFSAAFFWSLRRDWKSAAISTPLPLAGMGKLQ